MATDISQVELSPSLFELSGPSGRLRSTYQLMKYPYETYSSWSEKYGKTFLIKALNGNVVATSNGENIRRILAAKHDEVSQFAIGTIAPLIGENSVLIVDGQQHKRARSLLTPPFRGEALRSSMAIMQTIAERTAEKWQRGETIKVMDASLEYSLDVIIQVIFGVQNLEKVNEFKQAIKNYVASFRPMFAFTKLFQRRLFPSWNRFLKRKQIFNQLLDEQIAERKADKGQHSDFLSILLSVKDEDGISLKDDELKDHLIALLFAGHETTQIAIAWAMSWLHRQPEILSRLRQELNAAHGFDDCLKSELLDGVCQESLRLNPIVADFLRVFREPLELEELTLPANSTVAILSCVVHQDSEIYAHPEKFDPDRWINNKYKPHEFLAFGGGIRRCIGATMALMEMKVSLATWLNRFEFQLPENAPDVEPVHRRNLTMAPRSGIELKLV